MLYEYALISVIIASGYWGYYFLRNSPTGTPLFGLMQLATAGLAALGMLGQSYDSAVLGICGAIGLGAGVCLLIVGPLVRALARRFAAAERIGIASRLLDLADVLAPGSGVAEEKALLSAMREIREGRVEPTVEALTDAKHRAPAEAQLAIDERIAMLYLAAYRWRDAIAHAEAHLIPTSALHDDDEAFAAHSAANPMAFSPRAAKRPFAPSGASLRDALGIAPPVWVELLGAYGRTGDLERAARMMARLEDVCSGRDDASVWLHRARMMFLALAGRPAAVEALLEPRRARHMSAAARTYWVAVAHEHSGDRAAATAAYAKARGRSRGRPRELIDEAIARLPDARAVELSPETTELVAQIEARPLPVPIAHPRLTLPWATWGLTAAILIAAAAIAAAFGSSTDQGVLLRAGAMVRGRIDDGELWRLVTCIFIHVGALHLVINAIGLFFLGRILEEIFGTARTIAIFGGAGIAGAVASYLAVPAGMSAGASGAIFGVLGAVFVELTIHRQRYRAAWKRGLWGVIAVVTVAQAGIGFLYPVIDQWAHGAGLVAGLVLGAVLSPSVPWARINRRVAQVLAIAFAGLVVVAVVEVARTPVTASLGQHAKRDFVLRDGGGDIAITAPGDWRKLHSRTDYLVDVDSLAWLSAYTRPVGDAAAEPAGQVAYVTRDLRDHEVERIEPASDRVIAMPAGWTTSEHIASFEDAMGYEQHYRVVIAAKQFGDQVVVVWAYTPDSLARAAPELFAGILATAGPH